MLRCPVCKGTNFVAKTNWIFSQKVRGGRTYPEFLEIIKSKTVTEKVICQDCGNEVPKKVFKTWHLDEVVM